MGGHELDNSVPILLGNAVTGRFFVLAPSFQVMMKFFDFHRYILRGGMVPRKSGQITLACRKDTKNHIIKKFSSVLFLI